jgi:hypothetical protein
MHVRERLELDETRMTSEARRFAIRFFNRFPELRSYAAMERLPNDDAWTLVVTVPAPSGDPSSELLVWMEGGDDPSVEFGKWHTHDSFSGIFDIISGILADRYVVCEDISNEKYPGATILDLSVEDALLEQLTSKYSPGKAWLRSWSGRLDREVTLENI